MQTSKQAKLRWVSVDSHAIQAPKRKYPKPHGLVSPKKAKSDGGKTFRDRLSEDVHDDRGAPAVDRNVAKGSYENRVASKELVIHRSTSSSSEGFYGPTISQFLAANGDPFDTYPIRNVFSVDGAVDYWVRTYAPLHSPLIEDYGRYPYSIAPRNPFMSVVFSMAMVDAALFQTLVSFAQATSASAERTKPGASKALLIHRNEALARLRGRMSEERHLVDDVSILATTLLAAADLNLGNIDLCHLHLDAIRRMVEIRGGLRALGGAGFVKKLLMYICIRSGVSPPPEKTLPASRSTVPDAEAAPAVLEYACFPFSASTMTIISILPPLVREIAKAGVLSMETLHLLGRLSYYLRASERLRKGVGLIHDLNVSTAYEPLNEGYKAQQLASSISAQMPWSQRSFEAGTKAMATEQLMLTAFHLFIYAVTFRMKLMPSDQELLGFLAAYGAHWGMLTEPERRLLILTTIMVAEMGGECRLLQDQLEGLMSTILEQEEHCWEWEWVEGVCRSFYTIENLVSEWKSCWKLHVARKRRKSGSSGDL